MKFQSIWLSVVLIVCAAAAAAPRLIAQSGGSLIVLNKDEAALVIVDPQSKQVVGRVATGEGPHEVAVTDDGAQAFVGNYGTGPNPGRTISVIDLAGRRELRRVELGALQRPHGVFVFDRKLYFTAEA